MKTRDVVSHDHAVAHLKFGAPGFHHLAGNLVAQNNRVFQRLKPDLMNIRKTDSTGRHLQEEIALSKRGPGNLLNARLMFLRNERFHRA